MFRGSQVALPALPGYTFPTMNKLSACGVFLLCLFLGIIFEQVAIGIIAGLVLGAGAGEITAPKSGADTEKLSSAPSPAWAGEGGREAIG